MGNYENFLNKKKNSKILQFHFEKHEKINP